MSSKTDVFSTMREHLEKGHGGSLPHPTQPPAILPGSDAVTLVPHNPKPLLPLYEEEAKYADQNSETHGIGSDLETHVPTYTIAEDYHPQQPVYGHAWGISDTDLPLKDGTMGFAENEEDEFRQLHNQYIYPESSNGSAASLTDTLTDSKPQGKHTWSNAELLEQKINNRALGIGRQSYPYLTWFLSFGMVAVFIAELILAKERTGQAIQTKPNVQPMIGPAPEFMISFGARFVPCMRSMPGLPTTNMIPCLKYTTTSQTTFTKDELCTLSDICGLSNPQSPDQSYRFVSAIFVHAGIVHVLFNLVVMLTLCSQIEKLIGSIPYAIVFVAGGIGGNLLGGNFGLIGQPALGASGSVYTCISFEIVDLIYNWRYEMNVKTRVTMSIIFAIIGLALGLLPGLDNLSHIGGFCVGILGGMVFAPSIHHSKRHLMVNWVYRIIGVGLLVAYFLALALNFYRSDNPADACQWCRYLSCLPMFDACKGVGISTTTSDGTTAT